MFVFLQKLFSFVMIDTVFRVDFFHGFSMDQKAFSNMGLRCYKKKRKKKNLNIWKFFVKSKKKYNVLPATAVATESQSSILTSVVNVSRNADETFIISLRFPNRPEKNEKSTFESCFNHVVIKYGLFLFTSRHDQNMSWLNTYIITSDP